MKTLAVLGNITVAMLLYIWLAAPFVIMRSIFSSYLDSRFLETDLVTYPNYLNITTACPFCQSKLGMLGGGQSLCLINMADDGSTACGYSSRQAVGVIIHELGHVLGKIPIIYYVVVI